MGQPAIGRGRRVGVIRRRMESEADGLNIQVSDRVSIESIVTLTSVRRGEGWGGWDGAGERGQSGAGQWR